MAQVNIKDRIKELRLRVLAEPPGEAAPQLAEQSSAASEINQALNEPIPGEKIGDDNSAIRKRSRTKKVGKKNISETKEQQDNKKISEIKEDIYLSEELITPDTINGNSPENKFLSQEEKTSENIHIEKSYVKENTQAEKENENESDGIVDLTDKWVELEVRSRLSGLEQQEKQTRAMLKEIVDVLDRIETLEHVKPNELTPPRSVTKTNKQVSMVKKVSWSEVIKRTLVVIGTFLVLTGIIWGVLHYLFF